jgi:hypothetical protein
LATCLLITARSRNRQSRRVGSFADLIRAFDCTHRATGQLLAGTLTLVLGRDVAFGGNSANTTAVGWSSSPVLLLNRRPRLEPG